MAIIYHRRKFETYFRHRRRYEDNAVQEVVEVHEAPQLAGTNFIEAHRPKTKRVERKVRIQTKGNKFFYVTTLLPVTMPL